MARQAFTFESNLDKITVKIKEKPYKVLNIIGINLTKEIRATTLKTMFNQRSKFFQAYSPKIKGYIVSHWARKIEKDLQIGFKAPPQILADMMTGAKPDPLKPVVWKNRFVIRDMIAVALDEIRKEKR
jgi:hypothetical protein